MLMPAGRQGRKRRESKPATLGRLRFDRPPTAAPTPVPVVEQTPTKQPGEEKKPEAEGKGQLLLFSDV